MSTLANITSLNLSLQTGGAALAVKAAGRLVAPARTVFVYGTADDVAPNFTTVAGAITYANSLAPISTEPVVIRLYTKADGTPYDLTGLSSWTTYANSYIYFVSDFVRINVTTTLPTTLPPGLQVWYIDPNGVETLWVGNEDGIAQVVGSSAANVEQVASIPTSPTLANGDLKIYQDSVARGYLFQGDANSRGWPSVGYKEFAGSFSQATPTANLTGRIFINTLGSDTTFQRVGVGEYTCTPVVNILTANNVFFPNQAGLTPIYEAGSVISTPVGFYELSVVSGSVKLVIYDSANDGLTDLNSIIGTASISISFKHVQGTVVV